MGEGELKIESGKLKMEREVVSLWLLGVCEPVDAGQNSASVIQLFGYSTFALSTLNFQLSIFNSPLTLPIFAPHVYTKKIPGSAFFEG